jgi:hypothetical protein
MYVSELDNFSFVAIYNNQYRITYYIVHCKTLSICQVITSNEGSRAAPFSCVSVALVVDGVPNLSVVYDYSAEELFIAVKGRGAYLNDKKIVTSRVKAMSNAMIVSHILPK